MKGMKTLNKLMPIISLTALLFAGCWTFNETPFPEVQLAAAAGSAVTNTLSVSGFEALLTEYEAVNGFQTVYVPGHYGRRHYRPGYFEAVPVTTYVAQQRTTDMFLRRAQDDLEKAGFTLAVTNPDVLVDVAFTGPMRETNDAAVALAWELFSAFLCDYGAVSWSAKLRIRDARSGRLIFHHDYVQRYETNVFGLIPLFSISSCPETTASHMQTWCLAALTDRAVADAAAFLTSH